ncbi:hypothetical protein BD779DRAFT_1478238 [Infundibulicybe gibba]|nr:hypothetical protein BD779DRAFT_1685756 [Infundibulicybe gibba]KAF8871454.1 hypothetical protein BD779DRAFT_1478238 [Infundibulicybe gibba]
MSQPERVATVENLYDPNTFMPKGDSYNRGDYGRIRKLFPIAYTDVPRCLVDPRVFPKYIPPKIYLGWYIPGHSKGVINIAKEHFPEMTKLKSGRIKSDGFIFDQLPKFIRTHYQVPEREQGRVDVVDVTMKGSVGGLAVVVGSNIDGWLSEDLVERISNDLFNGQQPMWYIDPYKWGFVQPRHDY